MMYGRLILDREIHNNCFISCILNKNAIAVFRGYGKCMTENAIGSIDVSFGGSVADSDIYSRVSWFIDTANPKRRADI